MNARRTTTLALAAVLSVVLAGCGERPQIVEYKKGAYLGKTDTLPWDNPAFKGDRRAWEDALAHRAQGQNEYNRTQ